MSEESSDELLKRTLAFVNNHRTSYLESGGRQGHIMDMSHVGVNGMLPTLLLRTIGRKSGQPSTVPLIYGCCNGEWIVVASKGGAPTHPAWYLNLLEQQEVEFQVGTQCFNASWREPDATEYREIWDYMAKHYPPYNDYRQTAGNRVIPIVLLRPMSERDAFTP